MKHPELIGDAKEYYELIEELLDDDAYEFAEDTLLNMGEWIEENNHVTDKQKKAIENIRDSQL